MTRHYFRYTAADIVGEGIFILLPRDAKEAIAQLDAGISMYHVFERQSGIDATWAKLVIEYCDPWAGSEPKEMDA